MGIKLETVSIHHPYVSDKEKVETVIQFFFSKRQKYGMLFRSSDSRVETANTLIRLGRMMLIEDQRDKDIETNGKT